MVEKDDTIGKAPLISVIVPIFNVEKYVRKCLDSLVSQTMKQIEVICIDDGSTDRSGRIADEYASEEFPIFRVIHTENRGLSAARNRGIDEAVADWIMFVDSDDWVDREFCRVPFEAALENRAEMVIFHYTKARENGKVKLSISKVIYDGIINHEQAIDFGGAAAWRRIYRKDLFDDTRYPEGYVYEDAGTTHKLVYKANTIVALSKRLYFYRLRKDSICHLISSDSDRLKMGKLRYQDLIQVGYPKRKAQALLSGAALRCCGRSIKEDSIYLEAAAILDNTNGILSGLSGMEKVMLLLWRTNRNDYRIIYKLLTRQMHLL